MAAARQLELAQHLRGFRPQRGFGLEGGLEQAVARGRIGTQGEGEDGPGAAPLLVRHVEPFQTRGGPAHDGESQT